MVDVVDELEHLLEPIHYTQYTKRAREELQIIVREAISLDETFCGQQSWYHLVYPKDRYDGSLDSCMVADDKVELGAAKELSYLYVIRPLLRKTGGRCLKDWDTVIVLERAIVKR